MEEPALPRLPARHILAGIAVLFGVLAAATYGRVVGFPFVRWDDGLLITEQPAVQAIAPWSIAWIFTHYDPELYIPLTFLTYQFDWLIGGGAPWPFHLDNLLLHTISALLAAWTAFLLLPKSSSRIPLPALAVGLLFLLHPLHTEAVAWASARKDVLSTALFFAALLAYLYARDRDDRRLRLWSLVFFLLGLLSKVMVITLPIVLLLVEWRDGKLRRTGLWRDIAPYLALAAVFGVIALGGKQQLVVASSTATKLLMACKSAVFYLQQILWPRHFSLLYPYTEQVSLATADIAWSVGIIAVLCAVAVATVRRQRWIAFSLAFFLVTVAPTFLNFAKGGDMDVYFASDRYAYIPSFGIFLLAGWVASLAALRLPRLRVAVATVALAVIAALGLLAHRQLRVWETTETLFMNVIHFYPEASHVAHNNLGNAYRLRKAFMQAEEEYRKALAIRPHAKTLSNLGALLRQQGRLSEAHAVYAQALELDAASPFAHFGLGIVLAQEGQSAQAEARYREAMRLDPLFEEAPTNLGALFAAQGRWEDAVGAYEQALAINAYFPDARYNMAVALEALGRDNEAHEQYAWTIRLAPRFIAAYINDGILLAKMGDRDGAAERFRQVLAIDPGNGAARSALRQLGAD
ncbi:MAG: TPR repeat-containing protein [Candidatus Peregrinibacteria bacterium Gr01-1014_25]|nr:MAG: TPR repeat-containing protein [Candidatus Peregrinibacteria bacterium Gr01-1014_25]